MQFSVFENLISKHYEKNEKKMKKNEEKEKKPRH